MKPGIVYYQIIPKEETNELCVLYQNKVLKRLRVLVFRSRPNRLDEARGERQSEILWVFESVSAMFS